MSGRIKVTLAVILMACALNLSAQQRPVPVGPITSDQFRTTFVRLGNSDEGLLYEPLNPGANARVGLVLAHPAEDVLANLPVQEMAKRGYRVLAVNHHGDTTDMAVFAQPLSHAIGYLRTLPGVQHVVIMGHSGGGPLMAWYQNIAEHGPAACQGPEKIYPCDAEQLSNLAKPDGIIILDATLGAFHDMSAIDPAVNGDKRETSLDMFSAANGYDTGTGSAKYSPDFAKRFYAAQSARNASIVDNAIARLNALNQGKAQFTDDEPLLIRGMGVEAAGARLYQPDPSFAAHTKSPHTLLKADGTQPVVIVNSVRPPTGQQFAKSLDALNVMNKNTTVRKFLTSAAIRTGPDYAITADDIVGVDWASATTATPGNAEGITVPALILSNTCHYLIVPDEIIFNHLASKDKTLVYNEGAVHGFTPCRPEFGDTVKRAFDYLDGWLSKPERF